MVAHYTSMMNLENIARSGELWFSHPLLMNDHEEVVGGIIAALAELAASAPLIEAFATYGVEQGSEILSFFLMQLRLLAKAWGKDILKDIYVFCFSVHDHDDGLLSMWRGYGDDGRGAAIVFDPIGLQYRGTSPFLFDEVTYVSRGERASWINDKIIDPLCELLKTSPPPASEFQSLHMEIFERIALAAIFSKYAGFGEEREWRAVFMPDREEAKHYEQFKSFQNGPRGIEPRFKLRLEPGPGFLASDLSLEKLAKKVIIGPTRATDISMMAVERMLIEAGRPLLAKSVYASGIPYRPRN